MIDSGSIIFVIVLVGIGAIGTLHARRSYDRYKTLTGVISERVDSDDESSATTVSGPVDVTEPATPQREPPEELLDLDDSPALWAWRIRRKVRTGGKRNRTRWRTVDGGLAIGDISIREDWEHIDLDPSWLTSEVDGVLKQEDDPFSATHLYVGEPEEEVILGELDPINKRLERWGITGENGLLSDWEVTISFGRKTMTPDRYQATILRDGDELVAAGKLDDGYDDPILRGTDETPLLLAIGDLEQKANQLRSKSVRQALIGGTFLLVGAAVFFII